MLCGGLSELGSEMRGDGHRRSQIGLVISTLLHVAVGLLIVMLPERERPPLETDDLVAVDLVELEPFVAEEEPTGDVVAGSSEPSVEEPPAPSDPGPSDGAEPSFDPSPPSKPQTRAPSQPSSGVVLPEASESEDDDTGAGGALALSGLRQQGRPDSTGQVRGTVVSPGSPIQQRTEAAVRQSAASSPRTDGAPRSLGEAGFKRRRDGRMVYRDPRGKFKAYLHPDGRVEFKNMPVAINKSTLMPAMPGMSEAVRAAQGNELYRNEKKQLLDETFELRLSLAVGAARRHIDAQLDRLYRDLLDIWHDDESPAPTRRRLLFERWDECEEAFSGRAKLNPEFGDDGQARLDVIRAEAGKDARKRIEEFIRRHLPRGEDGYSRDELEALNRRRKSRTRFDPYG